MTLSINIIGAGKLGVALGRAIAKQTTCSIMGICNQRVHTALQAVSAMGQGLAYDTIPELPPADITFITTPDDSIESVALELSRSPALQAGSIIAHCSGVLDSYVLSALKQTDCHVASIHPMRSFARPLEADFNNAYCALEGDDKAKTTLMAFFSELGANCLPIQAKDKATYHTAGVFGANFLVTLNQLATHALHQAGIPDEDAMNITLDLMQSSLDNLKKTHSATASLTGPIARGDTDTLIKHLTALKEPAKSIYQLLGHFTLSLTSLDETQKKCIKQLLDTA